MSWKRKIILNDFVSDRDVAFKALNHTVLSPLLIFFLAFFNIMPVSLA